MQQDSVCSMGFQGIMAWHNLEGLKNAEHLFPSGLGCHMQYGTTFFMRDLATCRELTFLTSFMWASGFYSAICEITVKDFIEELIQ